MSEGSKSNLMKVRLKGYAYYSLNIYLCSSFQGPNERVTRLDWILSINIDKSHITKIKKVMPQIVRSYHTVLIANIDIKWKRFSAKISPKTDWSQLGNTDCRSRFVENFQKSREEGQDFVMLCLERSTI